jgi:hypothetical protein
MLRSLIGISLTFLYILRSLGALLEENYITLGKRKRKDIADKGTLYKEKKNVEDGTVSGPCLSVFCHLVSAPISLNELSSNLI